MGSLPSIFAESANISLARADVDELDALLRAAIAAGRARWPDVTLIDSDFAAFLGARIDLERSAAVQLEALRAEDAWLACACARADPAALRVFERTYFPVARVALARRQLDAATIDECLQQLRVHLFVATEQKPAAIARYGGASPLKAWTRLVAVRIALQMLRRRKPEVTLGSEIAPAAAPAPPLQKIERYRPPLREILAEVLSELEARDRTLLRHYYLHGMHFAQIARLYGVHRSRPQRWLERIRRSVRQAAEQRLRARFALDAQQLASVLSLVDEGLSLSLSRALR